MDESRPEIMVPISPIERKPTFFVTDVHSLELFQYQTRACRHLEDSQISQVVIHGEPS
jgi:hypothetical protein